MHGKGIFHRSDGTKYDGDWINGKMHGKGIFYKNTGHIEYEGDWINGEKCGKGVLYYFEDTKYDGE